MTYSDCFYVLGFVLLFLLPVVSLLKFDPRKNSAVVRVSPAPVPEPAQAAGGSASS